MGVSIATESDDFPDKAACGTLECGTHLIIQ